MNIISKIKEDINMSVWGSVYDSVSDSVWGSVWNSVKYSLQNTLRYYTFSSVDNIDQNIQNKLNEYEF